MRLDERMTLPSLGAGVSLLSLFLAPPPPGNSPRPMGADPCRAAGHAEVPARSLRSHSDKLCPTWLLFTRGRRHGENQRWNDDEQVNKSTATIRIRLPSALERRRQNAREEETTQRLPCRISLTPWKVSTSDPPYMSRTSPETNVHDLVADRTGKSGEPGRRRTGGSRMGKVKAKSKSRVGDGG